MDFLKRKPKDLDGAEADGRDAVYQGQSEPYDLIILDLGLPGLPGLDVLAQWRADLNAATVLPGQGQVSGIDWDGRVLRIASAA